MRRASSVPQPRLEIRLTRVDDARHRFAYTRPDGSSESLELETRSFLVHDLTHFALESAAKLTGGFYGALAAGTPYSALAGEAAMRMKGEAGDIETVVGPLSTALRGEMDAAAFTARVSGYFADLGHAVPAWLTPETIDAAAARFRALMGQWKATPFGGTMQIDWAV